MALVRICMKSELPPPGQLRELVAGDKVLCVANQSGECVAIDNACPHRGGPLAEGWLEEGRVVCPWHAWAFSLETGAAEHDGAERVRVYRLTVEGEEVLAEL